MPHALIFIEMTNDEVALQGHLGFTLSLLVKTTRCICICIGHVIMM
jgi:hypothetical protein